MGAIKLTSQSRLQTRKRGVREAQPLSPLSQFSFSCHHRAAEQPQPCAGCQSKLVTLFVARLISAQQVGPASCRGLVNKAVMLGRAVERAGHGEDRKCRRLCSREACLHGSTDSGSQEPTLLMSLHPEVQPSEGPVVSPK